MKIDNELVERGAEAIIEMVYGETGRGDIPVEVWATARASARVVLETCGPVFIRRAVRAVDEVQDAHWRGSLPYAPDAEADRAYINAKEAIRELVRPNVTIEGVAGEISSPASNDENEARDANDEPKGMD